jgi:hypothetical protein
VPGQVARDQVTADYLFMRWARWVVMAIGLGAVTCAALWRDVFAAVATP